MAVVSDPPYGIGYVHGGQDSSSHPTAFAGVKIEGDDAPFDPDFILACGAREIILWGANHYAHRLPPHAKWLSWDKRAASHHVNDHADMELAWSNLPGVARCFRHHWDGMMRASERGQPRVHPTQKPIALMKWCVGMTGGTVVIDPFMGSGTTGVACAKLNRKFIGIEIEPRYFDIACQRISEAYKQSDLFAPAQPAASQETFL